MPTNINLQINVAFIQISGPPKWLRLQPSLVFKVAPPYTVVWCFFFIEHCPPDCWPTDPLTELIKRASWSITGRVYYILSPLLLTEQINSYSWLISKEKVQYKRLGKEKYHVAGSYFT